MLAGLTPTIFALRQPWAGVVADGSPLGAPPFQPKLPLPRSGMQIDDTQFASPDKAIIPKPLLFTLRSPVENGSGNGEFLGGTGPFFPRLPLPRSGMQISPVQYDTPPPQYSPQPILFQLRSPVNDGDQEYGGVGPLVPRQPLPRSGMQISPVQYEPLQPQVFPRPVSFLLQNKLLVNIIGNRRALPLPPTRLVIYGVTRDSAGVILGSCDVHVFRTVDDVEVDQVVSDATTGVYRCAVAGGLTYYVVAYKAGSPDVSGTTLNTLIGGNDG